MVSSNVLSNILHSSFSGPTTICTLEIARVQLPRTFLRYSPSPNWARLTILFSKFWFGLCSSSSFSSSHSRLLHTHYPTSFLTLARTCSLWHSVHLQLHNCLPTEFHCFGSIIRSSLCVSFGEVAKRGQNSSRWGSSTFPAWFCRKLRTRLWVVGEKVPSEGANRER